ncbi:agmatinase [Candidatus Magnetomorum sp. HK-1]|nr:agmatinase [Candidatus Magnetomorum sp. HK-1]
MESNNKHYLRFLESELGKMPPEDCIFHIISAGYERSVTYGTGTKHGPEAIIKASQLLELFDGETIPADKGIYTHPPLIFGQSSEENLTLIENKVYSVLSKKCIPILLGGEHTVSVGAFKALARLDEAIGIVQFDAHADLRDSLDNNPFSHACVMKRAIDLSLSIAQFGVRSLSYEEHLFREKNSIFHMDAKVISEKGIPKTIFPDSFPEKIYITFDVDGLDPSVIPSTGTPDPGGILWYQALSLLKKMAYERTIVGFDVVELAPVEGLHSSDFTAARLVYAMMGLFE